MFSIVSVGRQIMTGNRSLNIVKKKVSNTLQNRSIKFADIFNPSMVSFSLKVHQTVTSFNIMTVKPMVGEHSINNNK